MYPASFDYVAPGTLKEAMDLLAQHGEDAKLLAGGHSLLPAMKLRLMQPRLLIDLARVPDLAGITVSATQVSIGAMTLHADVAASAELAQLLPGLGEAAIRIGDVQVRNRGTIGGSVAHADPAADYPVILSALNASMVVASPAGSRIIGVDQFFLDYFTTALEPGEVVTAVNIPLPPAGSGTAYAKLAHPASGYVVVSAGATISRDASGTCTAARVALGGLAGTPIRATVAEAALVGQQLTPEAIATAAAHAAEGTEPEGDIYASGEYRRHVAAVYAGKAIQAAVDRAAA